MVYIFLDSRMREMLIVFCNLYNSIKYKTTTIHIHLYTYVYIMNTIPLKLNYEPK